jgi:hypothetical protein
MKRKLLKLYVKAKPRVLRPSVIARRSFLKSILWQGEYGCGFPDWKDFADLEQFCKREPISMEHSVSLRG